MPKDSAFYFPHDSNAIQDPKMMTLLSECGLMGIGLFWIIIEILHQQDSGKITEEEFRRYLKFYYRCDDSKGKNYLEKIEQVLNTSGLLLNKDGFVYSERVLKNQKYRSEISQKRSIAGKKSAEIRLNSANVEQVLTNVQLGKEKKGKERKRNRKEIKEYRRFTKPTLEQIKAYCLERKNKIDPQYFFDKNESLGWVVGKNQAPMQDWKATIRTWERNEVIYGQSIKENQNRTGIVSDIEGDRRKKQLDSLGTTH